MQITAQTVYKLELSILWKVGSVRAYVQKSIPFCVFYLRFCDSRHESTHVATAAHSHAFANPFIAHRSSVLDQPGNHLLAFVVLCH